MRTIKIVVYLFDELSEDAKKRVLNDMFDINVDHDWWDATYQDAENVGLILNSFDLGRSQECTGVFKWDAEQCAKLVTEEHGETCRTWLEANDYLSDLTIKHLVSDAEEMEPNFLESMLYNYWLILNNEHEYRTSEKAIIETIQANEYEFTVDGKLI